MPFEKVRFEDFELDRNAFELRRAGVSSDWNVSRFRFFSFLRTITSAW